MDVENTNSWISQPDVCRYCLSTSGTWDVTSSYITENGIKEVYSNMLQECFGIALSYLTDWGPSRLVCGLCVGHLRDACSFKKQVLQAESHFINYSNCTKETTDQLEIKTETEATEQGSDDCYINDLGSPCADDNHQISKDDSQNKTKISNKTPIYRKGRQKTSLKVKRKRKNIDDCDSDTPIAELSRKNELSQQNMAVNEIENEKILLKENEVKNNKNTIEISNIESRSIPRNKVSRISAESHIDNRNLRSNITLVLRNSTILPFKFVNSSKYICLYCNAGYLFFKELKHHVVNVHSNISEKDIILCLKTPKDLIKADVSDIKCKLCEENFKTIDKLIDHLVSAHNKLYYNTPRLKPSHGILGFNLSSESLKCHVCSKDFRFFKNLSIHMNEHSTHFMCHFCGKKFVSDHRLQTHVLVHRKTDIRCKHCGKEFSTMSARSYHIRKIHNESNFKCPECPEVFSQYQHRLRHLVEKHKLKKPEFKCDICSKDFASSGGLRAHVRYSHLKNKEYPCSICGKVFIHKWIWQRHLDVHSGAKNYECKFCSKKFAKPYTLKIHMRIHLNDKRFECSVCKVAFIQKCSLKNHIRVHHPDVDLSKL